MTLIEGDGPLVPGQGPVRTGVTVILPHGGNLFREKVPCAIHVINGFGKCMGQEQVEELGNLEGPIALTGTMNVGVVTDAIIAYGIRENPDTGVRTSTINPVVGECSDMFLNDMQQACSGGACPVSDRRGEKWRRRGRSSWCRDRYVGVWVQRRNRDGVESNTGCPRRLDRWRAGASELWTA